MKITMKGDMGDADEMALLVCRTARAAHVIAHEARQNALIRRLFWLEVKDCNENRHEGVYEYCRQNGIVGFGIACAQQRNCVRSLPETRMYLFALYGG